MTYRVAGEEFGFASYAAGARHGIAVAAVLASELRGLRRRGRVLPFRDASPGCS